jgi:hypothetical protein
MKQHFGSPLKLIHALEILQSQEQGQVGFEDGCWSRVLAFVARGRWERRRKRKDRKKKESKNENNILMI